MTNPSTNESSKCQLCGKELKMARFWQRWCSKNCRLASYWKRKEEKIKEEALKCANKVWEKK